EQLGPVRRDLLQRDGDRPRDRHRHDPRDLRVEIRRAFGLRELSGSDSGAVFGGPRTPGAVRPPAVAGTFYEGDPESLRRNVSRMLGTGTPARSSFRALLLPHAGHVYSGRIAARGVGAVSWPERAILLGPNHRG